MKSYVYEEKLQANLSKMDMTVKEKLHLYFKNLELMCKSESLEGPPKEIENECLKCATSIENKMHNLPFNNNRRKAEDILDIVHTDLNGPHQTGYHGEKYFLSFIDDYSKLINVYCIRSKYGLWLLSAICKWGTELNRKNDKGTAMWQWEGIYECKSF